MAKTASEPTAATTIRPARAMGFRDVVLFYVVTGVSLRWIATAASIGASSVVLWMGAWLFLYVPLALSVIELSSRYPAEGGSTSGPRKPSARVPASLRGGCIGPAIYRTIRQF